MYAEKSGFLYRAGVEDPLFSSLYVADSGLVIFSKYPVIRSGFERFKLGLGPDANSSRGVLFAEILANN